MNAHECQSAKKGVSIMAANLFIRRSLSRYSLLIVSLLTLVGILSGCGASSTAVTSHPTGSTPTSTPIKEFKGTISEFPLPTPNFYPGGLLAGPDGNLWFTETVSNGCQSGKIGRITPEGKVSEFLLSSDSEAGGITTGPDSNLWFIESACAKSQNSKIGRITVSGTISEFSLSSNSNPSEITTGPDHALWFTEFGNNIQNDKIGRITTSGTISQFPLHTPSYHSYAITSGPDGNLWFSEADLDGWHNRIGRITPSGTISEYPVPELISSVY